MSQTFNPNLLFLEQQLRQDDCKIVALQGGVRSGKSYSALHFIIRLCHQYTGMTISIVRQTFPALRATIMRDFFEILQAADMYSEGNHNKSEHLYTFNGNIIEFFSIDDEQKVRGRKRDLLYCNEVNEIGIDKWRQLLLRTTGKVIADYNPSMFESFVYDEILTREDCRVLITTYKDNPFLSKSIVSEIERMRIVDPEGYKVFGEGQRGTTAGLILPVFQQIESFPSIPHGYGMDFGFTNDPTTLIKVGIEGDDMYLDEMLYQTAMTTPDIVRYFKSINLKREEIDADSAEPRVVEELRRAGFNVRPAIKGAGSIARGIDTIRRYNIHVTKRSVNLIKELRNYKYKLDTNNRPTNEPIDYWNHCIDATRYRATVIASKPKLTKAHFVFDN